MRAYRRAVGDRIRRKRKALRRTQIDLCYAAGVDRTTYQQIEGGESDPRLGDLALIARELQTSVSDLTNCEVPRPPQV